MKCLKCNSLDVKKSGLRKYPVFSKNRKRYKLIQNYRCVNNHFFKDPLADTLRYSNSFMEHVVFTYLKCLSLNTTIYLIREQFEEQILSKKLILSFIERIASKLPNLDSIDDLYKPLRSGYLAFDGVWFKFRGIDIVLIICFDPDTFDIIQAGFYTQESYNAYLSIINKVLSKYPYCDTLKIKGVYADGDRGFMKAKNELLPNVPFQLCTVHKELKMNKYIPVKSVTRSKQMSDKTKEEILKYQELFRECIYTKTKEEALNNLKKLEEYSNDKLNKLTITNKVRFKKTTKSLKYNFEYTLTHFKHTGMVKDNNLLECFNGYIKRRLKLMKNFKKLDNIEHYLKLFLLDFRFHTLRESRFKEKRGLSPLEIGGVTFNTKVYGLYPILCNLILLATVNFLIFCF